MDRKAKAEARREVLAELQELENKWLELKDRLDAANVHTAILSYAEAGEKDGLEEPAWTFMSSGDDCWVLRGLTDAINRVAIEMQGEYEEKSSASNLEDFEATD
jgi:hypothetical protein